MFYVLAGIHDKLLLKSKGASSLQTEKVPRSSGEDFAISAVSNPLSQSDGVMEQSNFYHLKADSHDYIFIFV